MFGLTLHPEPQPVLGLLTPTPKIKPYTVNLKPCVWIDLLVLVELEELPCVVERGRGADLQGLGGRVNLGGGGSAYCEGKQGDLGERANWRNSRAL